MFQQRWNQLRIAGYADSLCLVRNTPCLAGALITTMGTTSAFAAAPARWLHTCCTVTSCTQTGNHQHNDTTYAAHSTGDGHTNHTNTRMFPVAQRLVITPLTMATTMVVVMVTVSPAVTTDGYMQSSTSRCGRAADVPGRGTNRWEKSP